MIDTSSHVESLTYLLTYPKLTGCAGGECGTAGDRVGGQEPGAGDRTTRRGARDGRPRLAVERNSEPKIGSESVTIGIECESRNEGRTKALLGL